ncbi:uncharacterized protein VTP21DRAFT_9862 [Calcarisporiella thermophila]|uniref:uncharacterized protein n=1 Tax=Calcarisporiella thermophila TaxID=911321 RepID=UPI003742716D
MYDPNVPTPIQAYYIPAAKPKRYLKFCFGGCTPRAFKWIVGFLAVIIAIAIIAPIVVKFGFRRGCLIQQDPESIDSHPLTMQWDQATYPNLEFSLGDLGDNFKGYITNASGNTAMVKIYRSSDVVDVSVEQNGNIYRIKGSHGRLGCMRTKLRIYLPLGFQNVDVKGDVGSWEVSNVNITGRMSLKTNVGEINFSNVQAQSISGLSDLGEIKGDVAVSQGENIISTNTGKIEMTWKYPADAQVSISGSTKTGQGYFELPSHFRGSIDIETKPFLGRAIINDANVFYSTNTDSRKVGQRGGQGPQSCRLTSQMGNVELKFV